MRTVHRFALDVGHNRIHVPDRAEVIHVGEQGGALHCWVDLDTLAAKVPRVIEVLTTGDSIPVPAAHLGTVVSGGFVWHAYETDPR